MYHNFMAIDGTKKPVSCIISQKRGIVAYEKCLNECLYFLRNNMSYVGYI